MKVTDKDVAYVAELANLELTQQERQRMLRDLNSILEYVDRLNELDTSGVPPMAQVEAAGEETTSHSRADELVPCLARDEALRNAPVSDGAFFKVPRVIEK